MFAAAEARHISLRAGLEEVSTFCAGDVKVLPLCGSHCSGLSASGGGWGSLQCTETHTHTHRASLREAPGHLASQAPAGKMRTHLGSMCVLLCCLRTGMWYLGDKLDIFLVFLHISWRSGALTWCEGFRQSLITNKMSIFESTLSRLMLLSYLKSDIVPRYSNVKQAYCNHSFYILGSRSHYGWSRLGYMKYPHILFQPPLA